MKVYTQEQLQLLAYLGTQAANTMAWVDEDPQNRWASYAVVDIDHWIDQGINNIAQYERDDLIASYIDIYKDANGIKPRWINFDSMTNEELERDIDMMCEEISAQIEYEKAQYALEEEYRAHYNELCEEAERYEDAMLSTPEPTKYELMAEQAGF